MTLDMVDKFSLSFRLIVTAVLSVGNLIVPDIFDSYIAYNIKRMNNIISNGEYSSERIQNEVQPNESRACDVVEESTGSCGENDYDKVSTSESDQSESDEGETSS